MKALKYIAFSILGSTALTAADTLHIYKGWNLLGVEDQINLSKDLPALLGNNLTKIKTIWLWDAKNQKWKVWSPDPTIQKLIEEAAKNYPNAIEGLAEVIEPYSGFWLQATGDFDIVFNNTETISNSTNNNMTVFTWNTDEISTFLSQLNAFKMYLISYSGYNWIQSYDCQGEWNNNTQSIHISCQSSEDLAVGIPPKDIPSSFEDTLTPAVCTEEENGKSYTCLVSNEDNYTYPAVYINKDNPFLALDVEDDNATAVIIPSSELPNNKAIPTKVIFLKPYDPLNCNEGMCYLSFYTAWEFVIPSANGTLYSLEENGQTNGMLYSLLENNKEATVTVQLPLAPHSQTVKGFHIENPAAGLNMDIFYLTKTAGYGPAVAILYDNNTQIDDIDLILFNTSY